MFVEPHIKAEKKGWIEVVCGSMFSGKTEELIRRLKRARFANKKIRTFKPAMDTRYHETQIVSHDENNFESIPVHTAAEIPELAKGFDVVAIDEAQFFDDDLPEICEKLAISGIRVIVAGLDMDYRGKPFGPMPALMAMAEYVTKLHAICMVCGNIATHSYRIASDDSTILLGQKETYEARCRSCFSLKAEATASKDV